MGGLTLRARALALSLVFAAALPLVLLDQNEPGLPSVDFGRLPLSFERNAGQADPAARFLVRQPGGTLYFARSEVAVATRSGVVRMRFVAPSASTRVTGGKPLPGKVNYLTGEDQSHWRTGIATFSSIVYRGLYPGIDVSYAGAGGRLKGTYTVAPGADASLIRWRYPNALAVGVTEAGSLRVSVQGGGKATEQPPVAWQVIDGRRLPVRARYDVAADGTIGFALGRYDRARALTIDPVLMYSTYLGGASDDHARDVALDGAGNVYVVGTTVSSAFPVANALQPSKAYSRDAFVTKLNAAGTALVYSTYFGGNQDDTGWDVDVDASGNVYLTGDTRSSNLPVKNALDASWNQNLDAYAAKLDSSGAALAYSTYLGGAGFTDTGYGVVADDSGNAYFTGQTGSNDFPTTAGAYQRVLRGAGDAYLTKLGPSGSLVYSTYLGGTDPNMWDGGNEVAVDSSGSAYVTGGAASADFPTTAGAYDTSCGGDAYVTKVNSAGSDLSYSTCVGGSGGEEGVGLALDQQGNAYVSGTTSSPDFPTVSAIQSVRRGDRDAFVTKVNTSGSALAYSTYLGGDYYGYGAGDYDYGRGIAVDGSGSAYIVGETQAKDFPLRNELHGWKGSNEGFVTKLAPSGSSLVYSTYLGGAGGDLGYGVAVDTSGNAYVVGSTFSADFPVVNAFQAKATGGYDAFVARIGDGAAVSADVAIAMSDSPDPIQAGSELKYVATIANAGPDTATGVAFTATVPGSVTYSYALASQGPMCSGTQTITCNLGSIARGASATVTIAVKPQTAGTISASASASGNEVDPNPANNSAAAQTTVQAGGCTITGTAGADTLTGTAGRDVICGLGGNDRIDGAGGDDTIQGGEGNDVLIGGPGANVIEGGMGVDTVDYSAANVRVTVDLALGTASGPAGDQLVEIENATGTAYNDSLVGNSLNNVLRGGNADDVLSGVGGNDTLEGGAGSETLDGGDGNDTLDGGTEADILRGGPGKGDLATYAARKAAVSVTVGAGAGNDGQGGEGDTVEADVEKITAGTGADTIVGGDAANTLKGGAGADTIQGGLGNDTLEGGSDADILRGDGGNDSIKSRDGTSDQVACAEGSDSVTADASDAVAADCETVTR